uniref:Uncharacterized protein AlNc14C131G6961 n=1 Tax=Albugo laibachii Nc14 TaxID=890382 RepID=F0WKA8_9STRA|nr:conserved hypothetical protein [Albugo laibachii Nc14]CCA21863.1 conserved hypothetical protein [Albugo laibachii Nc14]|eukprot:CCA21863.1 conserved hypothetical protein [Albugo laibachii Nc14]
MTRTKKEIQRGAWNNGKDSNNNNPDQQDATKAMMHKDCDVQHTELLLIHNGKRASIITSDICEATQTPWTPKALGRAKSAFIYKQSLNDTLFIMERNILFFSDWTSYFVSLQQKHLLLYSSREKWEQGLSPDKIVKLTSAMMLGEMKVEDAIEDRYNNNSGRLFRRKILEVDNLDEWVNLELQQGLVIGSGSNVDATHNNNPKASTHCVIEFATHNQNTFELWTKAIRRVLQAQNLFPVNEVMTKYGNNEEQVQEIDSWVSPGRDSRLSLHQSEIWCQRVLAEDRDKAESEMRRIIAMEKLISQVTNPKMALLVYEKVSRVHELFVANSRREIERLDGRQSPMSPKILNFFADHLKRKYSVFLNLALAYGNHEEQIRQAHETMCHENAATDSGIGGGDGEVTRAIASYGFEDKESFELYEKYRDAAQNYYRMNYGESTTAEEEDAVMHLPVMLQVSIIRKDEDERRAMSSILKTVKKRLQDHSSIQENETY